MPPSTKRAVIFDFDGVVADSWKLHESSWQKILKDHGAELDSDTLEKALGWTSPETAKVLIKELDLNVSAEQIAHEKSALMLERSKTDMPKMPGIDAAIKRLKPEFALAVVSGRKKILVGPALARYGLSTAFDLVITSEDRKDDDELSDLLATVSERLEIKPDQTAMVDDSRNGLLAAERAGLRTIAFDANSKHDVDYSMSDAVIKSLNELVPELVQSVTAN